MGKRGTVARAEGSKKRRLPRDFPDLEYLILSSEHFQLLKPALKFPSSSRPWLSVETLDIGGRGRGPARAAADR